MTKFVIREINPKVENWLRLSTFLPQFQVSPTRVDKVNQLKIGEIRESLDQTVVRYCVTEQCLQSLQSYLTSRGVRLTH